MRAINNLYTNETFNNNINLSSNKYVSSPEQKTTFQSYNDIKKNDKSSEYFDANSTLRISNDIKKNNINLISDTNFNSEQPLKDNKMLYNNL